MLPMRPCAPSYMQFDSSQRLRNFCFKPAQRATLAWSIGVPALVAASESYLEAAVTVSRAFEFELG